MGLLVVRLLVAVCAFHLLNLPANVIYFTLKSFGVIMSPLPVKLIDLLL